MRPHLFETLLAATEGEKASYTDQLFVGVIVGAACHSACRSLIPQALKRLRLPPPSPPPFSAFELIQALSGLPHKGSLMEQVLSAGVTINEIGQGTY